ncbi:TonB-dependent receptor [Solilutibacter silvestris]|uniref:TonB-dependent receptor n=1 Tax=Solilutibacter silvestris TaxID=1645665 RepID=UPI003D336426
MASKSLKSTVRISALAAALSMCFAGTVGAQSTVGSIFGNAKAGDQVTIQNTDTGFTRVVSVGSDGKYSFAQLPPGNYRVTSNGVSQDAFVKINSGTSVNFGGAAAAKSGDLGTVTVVGSAYNANAIDVTKVESTTVFTAKQLQQIPVAHGVASVALLAPGVVANSSYAANAPSFGGSASSENAYYINGFPVTNPLTSLGFTTLPFDAIDQEEVLTAGYGAQFGRSTGGVVNVTTKRGSNAWHFGALAIYAPSSWRSNYRDYYYPTTGRVPATDGTLYQRRQENKLGSLQYGLYASGPIIKDHLFFYASADLTKQHDESNGITRLSATSRTGWADREYKYPRGLVKLDWQINSNHLLEFTGISDVTKQDQKLVSYDYNGFVHGSTQNGGGNFEDNARTYIGKYTGHFGQNLTISLLGGQQKVTHTQDLFGYNPNCPVIAGQNVAANRAPGLTYTVGCQGAASVAVPGAYDKTRALRFDVEYVLGRHTLGAGIDNMTATSLTGTQTAGGYSWTYNFTSTPNGPVDAGHGVGSPASAGGLGTQGFWVDKTIIVNKGLVKTDQKAYYLTDKWKITDNFLLSIGVRNENFTNYTGTGKKYVEQKNQWAPRLGFSWDVNGDSSLKVFGNAGRYHLVLPNNVAVRAASGSLFTVQSFTYTGVDPATGAPTGLTPIAVDASKGYVCPGTQAISSNLECGQAPDPRTVAAKNLKGHFQDEYVLGFQHQITPTVTWGLKYQYRALRSSIDDTCTPALGGACFIFNPGVGNTFLEQQPDGSFKEHYYSAEQLALPKLKRKYSALHAFVEHTLANNWYGKLEYVFSKNTGNAEGQLNSDIDTGAGGQADVAVTQDWDLPQLMVNSYGYLPNDRPHVLKAYGFYRFSKQFQVGATAVISAGRPTSCTSFYPTADAGLYNGSFYHFCGIQTTAVQPGAYTPAPRGSLGRTQWTHQYNLQFRYTPTFAQNKLSFMLDIYNVFNEQVAQYKYARIQSSRTVANPRFGQDLSYTAPRYAAFTVRYDY